jgi:hypothetical protein
MGEINKLEQTLGLTEDEILRRCSSESLICAPKPRYWTRYWTAEIYSFGKYLREYGYYPEWLPLYVSTDHGPRVIDELLKIELDCDAPVQFYHSPRLVESWKKISTKPCYTMFSPFVFYRRTRKITQNIDAKGTLAYPAHTTPNIDDEANYEIYIEQLMSLPKEFHPIAVQLHYHDIRKERHKLFLKYKIPVYTAGHNADYRFAERFYEILRQFKYTTSNMVTSSLFYSVEMGIPHSIYGIEPAYNNKSDIDFEKGKINLFKYSNYRKIYDLFKGIHYEINDDQKKIVEQELGINDGIGRLQMSFILYQSLLKIFLRKVRSKLKNINLRML